MTSTSTAVVPARSTHAEFHRLSVERIDRLTDDSVAITFDVPPELAESYDFRAGQHLNVRMLDEPGDVRRSYSICTPEGSGVLRIGVKQIPNGAFSWHAATAMRPGDELDVMTPAGRFTIDLDPAHPRRYGFVAAGSGITPVLSLVATVLEREPESSVTLLYGNRTASSVMFAEEVADLKDRYPTRLHVLHVLSREPGGADLFSGRIDTDRLARLCDAFALTDGPGAVDDWYLCGPFTMVAGARDLLQQRGVARRHLHAEVFHVDETGGTGPGAAPAPPTGSAGAQTETAHVTVTLDGRSTSLQVPYAGGPVLDAVLQARSDAPFACRGGVCGTCRAKLLDGEVAMDTNWALEPDELDAGYVLTCQSHPRTPTVRLDYDA